MKKKIAWGFFVLVIGLIVSGCATRLSAFTIISTKSIDWSRASEFMRYNQRVAGKDMYHIIIFIPTKMTVTIEDAVDKALEKVPGGIALVDAVIRQKFFWIPYIYGTAGFIVEGTVLIDPKFASVNEFTEAKYLGFYTTNGTEFIRIEMTEEEYNNYL